MNQKLLNPTFVGVETIKALIAEYEAQGGLSGAFRATGALGYSPITETYISDNGNYADAAVGEIELNRLDIDRIIATLSGVAPPRSNYRDIPAQDWRAGAFDLAQFSRYRTSGPGNCIFVNCAPRLEQRGVQTDNTGEKIYAGMLPNGTVVAGVSPHSFAFFRDLVAETKMEIYEVGVQNKGSQFRSRDFFPWFSKLLAHNLGQNHQGWKKDLTVEERRAFLKQLNFINTGSRLGLESIPDLVKKPVVARVDTHGNLKLSLTRSDVKLEWLDRPLTVTINGKPYEAEIRDHMFDNDTPLAGIAPGSSGQWPDSSKDDPRFLEIALMGRSLRDDAGITDQLLKEGVFVEIRVASHENVVSLVTAGAAVSAAGQREPKADATPY